MRWHNRVFLPSLRSRKVSKIARKAGGKINRGAVCECLSAECNITSRSHPARSFTTIVNSELQALIAELSYDRIARGYLRRQQTKVGIRN
jgi:hypothetical protein